MVVFTGSTVEEAIQKGLKELDIPRLKAHIKVISREKNGFLGLFGKKPAQVDIEAISETTVIKANQQAVKGVPKEINEQVGAMRNIISHYFDGHNVNINDDIINNVKEADRLYIIGCGTSYNAGLVGRAYFERWAGIPTEVHLASEFAYNVPLLSKKPMFIFLSQSGETADLRAVLTKLRSVNSDYKFLVLKP